MLLTKLELPATESALPGRQTPLSVENRHFVTGHPIKEPFEDMSSALFGMGCFWGAEKLFWEAPGIYTTAVGYAGGATENPTYEEVCTGLTGHAEVVLVVWDPTSTSFEKVLQLFWEGHDPTQGMRQGNDVGTQYRSAIYVGSPTESERASHSRDRYQKRLTASGYGAISTELGLGQNFYYAETYHQQYLAKNPGGYCGLAGTGIACPTGLIPERKPTPRS